MSKFLESYHVQDGCHNCKHVFVFRDWDSEDKLYCALNAPMEPSDLDPKWWDWADGRSVDSTGTCDAYERAKK